ncbi:hypothetical protein K1719_044565 [Acacia pycnantha]|nr:hypothetical protein K1719_044565 [Acacia pycnantha]
MASKDHTVISGSSNPAYEIVKHIMIDIKNEPEDLNTTKWNIYKVPCNLRGLNRSAYTPQLISIGPLHYGRQKLNPMQKQKLRYLNLFRCRVKNNMDEFKEYLKSKEAFIRQCYPEKLRDDIDNEKLVEMMLDEFKEYLKRKEADIRQCYAEKLCDDFDKEKLVEMMLLDSVFIMELFLRIQNIEKQTYSNDIIVKQSWLNKSIQRDLLLLENQIPLFILEELHKTFVPDSRKEPPTFIELASAYFDSYRPYEKCDEEKKSSTGFLQFMKCGTNTKGDSSSGGKTGSSDSKGEPPKHFTDLIRSFYICKDPCPCEKGSPSRTATKSSESGVSFENDVNKPLRTATKLTESGVSFEKVDNKPLLHIKFQTHRILSYFLCFGCFPKSSYFRARLRIPRLKVDDTTECVLRNLIAFEQCHYPDQPYICNYVSFIDSLIHTKDDVELLVEKEVIVHELGSDKEVATLVNGLCKHVVSDKTCYKKIINDLNEHYQRQWNRTMAALRLVYFRDAWRASSTLVATAVLVFTIFNFCRVVRLVLDLEGNKQP